MSSNDSFTNTFALLENELAKHESVAESLDFCFIDNVFNDIISDLDESDPDIPLYSHNFAQSKKAIEVFKSTDLLLLLFNELFDQLMYTQNRRDSILDVVKSWTSTIIPPKKEIILMPKKTNFNSFRNDAHKLYEESCLINEDLQRQYDELSWKTRELLKSREEKKNAIMKKSYSTETRHYEDQYERRYIRMSADLISVVDSLNMNISEGRYTPPEWDK